MRDRGCGNRPEFGDRDLEIREQLQQKRLELIVGAVDLVDQQHRRFGPADRGEQRPFQQVFFGKNPVLDGLGIGAVMGLDREQLALVVPFIERGRLIEPLIALQADQFGRVREGQRLCHLSLAAARLAFEQKRTPQQLHQRDRSREFTIGDVAGSRQRLRDLLAVFHCQCVLLFCFFSPPPAKRRGGGGGGSANSLPERSKRRPPPPPPPQERAGAGEEQAETPPPPPRARARGGRGDDHQAANTPRFFAARQLRQ